MIVGTQRASLIYSMIGTFTSIYCPNTINLILLHSCMHIKTVIYYHYCLASQLNHSKCIASQVSFMWYRIHVVATMHSHALDIALYNIYLATHKNANHRERLHVIYHYGINFASYKLAQSLCHGLHCHQLLPSANGRSTTETVTSDLLSVA